MLITYVRLSFVDFLGGKFSVAVGSTLKIRYKFGPLKATVVSTHYLYCVLCTVLAVEDK